MKLALIQIAFAASAGPGFEKALMLDRSERRLPKLGRQRLLP
jgi:hypothetical protein